MHDCSVKIQLIIILMLISASMGHCILYSTRNVGKLVALLGYSSLRQVATSGIQNNSVANSSFSWNWVSHAQMKSEYGITPYSPKHCSTA